MICVARDRPATLPPYESNQSSNVGTDGYRKVVLRRTRIRHLLAAFARAHHLLGWTGERRGREHGDRAAIVFGA